LKAAVQSGRFREDLYYRLAVLEMLLPPLRERGRDIEILADCFLKRYASELNKTLTGFAPEASLVLRFYRWPGNVRELENVVARAVVFAQGSLVQPGDIHLPCRQSQPEPRKCSFKASKTDAIQIFEMNYLTQILQEYKGNISHAAKAAGKDRRAFWQLLRKHGIPPSPARTIVLGPLPQSGTVRPAAQQ